MMETEQMLYTIQEAAQKLSTSKGFVRKLIRSGELMAVKQGTRFVRVRVDSLAAYIEENTG